MSLTVFYYHIVWRTKCSQRTLTSRDRLYAYIMGFCKNKGCWLSSVGGVDDHIHMLICIRPEMCVSSFMQVLKVETAKWMKQNREFFPYFDGWAKGYAGFTYCERDRQKIDRYIANQEEHHKRMSFQDEYQAMLRAWGIASQADTFMQD